jgi:predicted TIM-barrel fold metal-dependent hydrolase
MSETPADPGPPDPIGRKRPRIVDTHQHVFWHGRDDLGLIADMDAHGIDYAWLLTWEIAPFEDDHAYHKVLNPANLRSDGTHAGIVLADLVRARDRFPERFILGYCPHPMHPMAPELLRAAVRMYGVRVCGEWKFRLPFDDPRCIRLFDTAGELRLPVVLHLDIPFLSDGKGGRKYDPRWYGGTVENLERVLQACPGTTFIGHAPGFWREISGDAADDPAIYPRGGVTPGGRLYQLFEKYPNLFADLSAGSGRFALEREPGHAVDFLVRFQDRLLFARDGYEQELYRFLQTLPLPEEVVAKIFFRNAERLVPREGTR